LPTIRVLLFSIIKHLNLLQMKKLKFILANVLVIVFSISSYAQMTDHSKMASTKTETIKVWGNCGSCKARIDKAAKIDGVSKADWDKDTKILTLVYDPSKVKSDDVQKKIASAGHDTEKFKADDKAYNKLPGCCQYVRKD
jgi:mercuric ion binding protein